MKMEKKNVIILGFMLLVFLTVWNGLAGIVDATNSPILHRFSTISTIALTIPTNGDVNPYSVAKVKHSTGKLIEGHILVSNFNNSGNLRSRGSTILDVAPDGSVTPFSQITAETLPGSCPGGFGQATGLVVLRDGWVIVGSFPVIKGTTAAAQAGCLIVLDNMGRPVETFSGSLINGPWEMVAYESDHEASVFVTNVLNRAATDDGQIMNEGSVVRINLDIPAYGMPRITSMTVVASGFPESSEPAALVTGPTGLGLSPKCGNSDEDNCPDYGERKEQALYVTDSLTNRVAVIENALNRTTSAGIGQTLSVGGSLNGPHGLIVAPNGHILTVNRNDGIITEITPQGQQIAKAAGGRYRQTAWSRSVTQPTF